MPPLFLRSYDFPKVISVLDVHSRQDVAPPADGVNHLVLVDNTGCVHVLPASEFRALGIGLSHEIQTLGAVVVLVPDLQKGMYFNAVIKHLLAV